MPDGYVRGMPRVTPRVGGGGVTPPDRIWTPPGGEIIQDEFDDASIDPAWTRVDKSSSTYVTWTEAGGVMSQFHTSSASAGGAMHALMRPLPGGTTFPVTVEIYSHGTILRNANYLMMGACFSDGLSLSGTNQLVTMPYCNSSSELSMYMDLRSGNGYGVDVQEVAGGLYGHMMIGLYQQLQWTATNTFVYRWSSDGVNWLSAGSATAQACTPTHVGIWGSNWAGAYATQLGFEYFRVYASDDPAGDVDTL